MEITEIWGKNEEFYLSPDFKIKEINQQIYSGTDTFFVGANLFCGCKYCPLVTDLQNRCEFTTWWPEGSCPAQTWRP